MSQVVIIPFSPFQLNKLVNTENGNKMEETLTEKNEEISGRKAHKHMEA